MPPIHLRAAAIGGAPGADAADRLEHWIDEKIAVEQPTPAALDEAWSGRVLRRWRVRPASYGG